MCVTQNVNGLDTVFLLIRTILEIPKSQIMICLELLSFRSGSVFRDDPFMFSNSAFQRPVDLLLGCILESPGGLLRTF